MENNKPSPFKFLDPYRKEDIDIWFGRDEETIGLKNAIKGVKLLLLYGPSGAGKTSLIECGLRNQFSDTDWFGITIRRGKNIINSFFETINKQLQDKLELDKFVKEDVSELQTKLSFSEAVEKLYQEEYKPIYLIFDQFEELLIIDSENQLKEINLFFKSLSKLLSGKSPCRVILVLREDFIAHLSNYEDLCPELFSHRFRLESMRKDKVTEVIHKTLTASRFKDDFVIDENVNELTDEIIKRLPDKRNEINLAHFQVFLDELWERANRENIDTPDQLPVFSRELLEVTDSLETILDNFLKGLLIRLNDRYGKEFPFEVLALMITDHFTKMQISQQELALRIKENKITIPNSLAGLLNIFDENKIIRSFYTDGKIQYEISHDSLAKVIGNNLTDEIRRRKLAKHVFTLYSENTGILSKEEIKSIEEYSKYRKIPVGLEKLIETSNNHWTEQSIKELEEKKKKSIPRINLEPIPDDLINASGNEFVESTPNRSNKKGMDVIIPILVSVLVLSVSILVFALYRDNNSIDSKIENLENSIKETSDLIKGYNTNVLKLEKKLIEEKKALFSLKVMKTLEAQRKKAQNSYLSEEEQEKTLDFIKILEALTEQEKVLGSPQLKNTIDQEKTLFFIKILEALIEQEKVLDSLQFSKAITEQGGIFDYLAEKNLIEQEKVLGSSQLKNTIEQEKTLFFIKVLKALVEQEKVLDSLQFSKVITEQGGIFDYLAEKNLIEQEKVLGSSQLKNTIEQEKTLDSIKELKDIIEQEKIFDSL